MKSLNFLKKIIFLPLGWSRFLHCPILESFFPFLLAGKDFESRNRAQSEMIQAHSFNGYVLISSLLCLFLVLQLCLLCTIKLQSKIMLIRASDQSAFDLALYSHCRSLAAGNAYARRCSLESELEEERMVEIKDTEVQLTDYQTMVEAVFEKNGKAVRFRMYYGENGITATEWLSSENEE